MAGPAAQGLRPPGWGEVADGVGAAAFRTSRALRQAAASASGILGTASASWYRRIASSRRWAWARRAATSAKPWAGICSFGAQIRTPHLGGLLGRTGLMTASDDRDLQRWPSPTPTISACPAGPDLPCHTCPHPGPTSGATPDAMTTLPEWRQVHGVFIMPAGFSSDGHRDGSGPAKTGRPTR